MAPRIIVLDEDRCRHCALYHGKLHTADYPSVYLLHAQKPIKFFFWNFEILKAVHGLDMGLDRPH